MFSKAKMLKIMDGNNREIKWWWQEKYCVTGRNGVPCSIITVYRVFQK
jgi:hypothetical protein